jgi:hypothetical protein
LRFGLLAAAFLAVSAWLPLRIPLPVAPAPAGAADAPQPAWDHYLDQEEVTDLLKQLHDAYPHLTGLESIGTSAEGRDIWALTITNARTGAAATKPAMYVDGAVHGNEIQATDVCLYTAWLLLDRYGEWERITELVDRVAFYVVPTVNVDSRAHFFSEPGNYNIGRTARIPYDDDHDGLVDEDPPEDIDGDGMIVQMRIRDPFGTHKTHPDDPRTMVRIEPGETAEWTRLGREGIDNDGDGRVNEDGPGYLDLNRNFPFQWQPRYVQAGAGDYPLSASNTAAVADFVAARPNIAFAFAFHNYGGMWLRGPGSDLSPPFPPADVEVFDYLGREGERTVPGYRYLVSKDDLYTTHGDFDEFVYQLFGIYAFVGEVYMSSEIAYAGRSDDPNGPDGNLWSRRPGFVERQEFNDHLMMGEMFVDWHEVEHPTFGTIEVGGWKQQTVRMSPGWMLRETLHRNAMFVIWTATQLPQVSVEITEISSLGQGLWRVRARAANSGALPTLSAQARRRDLLRHDLFSLAGDGATVVSGSVLLDSHHGTLDPRDNRPERVLTWVPAFGKRDVQWIVTGEGSVTVSYEGYKCGRAEASAELR